ncbi:Flagellar basal-body rod modification protein FlgD [hydrothermal vent metagenome]|uniref:Flagellar basal-body rod modification protein FlgD n=1 Tax=hydrothermal vent metagenome TaxID=652676 RepID=A0A3B0RVY5_9ZZZZ
MEINSASAVNASEATRSETKLADDFDQFLTLLTTQLQFQDPLDPMKSSEFTNQLVSFSQVEQSITTNKNLENLISQTKTQAMSNAVGYLGKEVTIETDRAGLRNGVATWEYGLETNAEETKLTVTDSTGKLLFEGLGNNKAGLHEFVWDAPANTPDGIYQLSLSAQTANGTDVQFAIYSKGRVETIEALNGDVNLSVNGILTATSNIQAVKP